MIYVHQPQLPITYLQLHYCHHHEAQEEDSRLSPALRVLTQRQLIRGTQRATREQFVRDIEQLGTEMILTHRHYAHSLGAVALSRTLPQLISLFDEALTRPLLDTDELEQSKRAYIAELESRYDDDHSMAWLCLARRLHVRHPLWLDYSVETSQIEEIMIDHIQAVWPKFFDPATLLPCITSDLSKEEIQTLISPIHTQDLTSTPKIKPLPSLPILRESTLTTVHKSGKKQALIFIAHPTIPPSHPQSFALQVALCALGGTFSSLLMQEVRVKRSLSYGAYAGMRGEANARFVCLNATPDAHNALETLEVMLAVYEKGAQGELTDEALLFAKDYMINAHPFSIETPAMRAGLSANATLMGFDPARLLDTPRWLAPLTIDDIRQAARDHLSTDRLEILVYGDHEQEMKGLPNKVRKIIPVQRFISILASDGPTAIKGDKHDISDCL